MFFCEAQDFMNLNAIHYEKYSTVSMELEQQICYLCSIDLEFDDVYIELSLLSLMRGVNDKT